MSYRTFVRIASAVLAVATFCSSAAPAVARSSAPGAAASGPVAYAKPPVVPHADRAPSVPGSLIARTKPTRRALPAPVAPKPDRSGAGSRHAMAAGPAASPGLATSLDALNPLGTFGGITGSGGGTNMISFSNFDSGDMVVVLDPSSLTGHAGLFDRRFYTDIRSYAVLSANVAPADGVQREQCLKYRTYDHAWALWVPSESNHGAAARDYAYKQMGKPYNLLASKTDLRSFYCSKLAWVAWRYTSGLDLDADGGYWVWPVDLVNSRYTRSFGYWA